VLARSGKQVTKFGCDGTPLWSKPFGSQVAVDDDDDVYVAGTSAARSPSTRPRWKRKH